MSYIYKITNDINDKVYVGKTDFNIEKRFKEHCRDSQKNTEESRPLYRAMNKYGIDHFSISLIEETNNPEEREMYWIEFYNSFKNGYNATQGGDGKHYADYDMIYDLWHNQHLTFQQIGQLTGYSQQTIERALSSYNISKSDRQRLGMFNTFKSVARLDAQTGEVLELFSSVQEAENKYNTNHHISQVCNGDRKTAGGYGWKYV